MTKCYKKVKSYCLVDNNSMLRICKHTLIRKENVFLIEARKIFDSDKRFVLTDSENFSSTFDLQFDRVLSSGIPDQECVILCM